MRIIYFTSSMIPDDFNKLVLSSRIAPNPSNQNFHRKLIRALALYNDVEVISNRPSATQTNPNNKFKNEIKADGLINYNYIGFINSRIFKPITFGANTATNLHRLFRKKQDTVILVDSLNYSLVHAAQAQGLLRKIPVIGVFTDNPQNLSSVNKRYLRRITKTFPNYDMYLTLTDGLNDMANINKKPSYIFPGLVEAPKFISSESDGNTFFFGGAIYRRYGIESLIEAFSSLPGDYNLLIAGQGPDINMVRKASLRDPRIIYLGVLSSQKTLRYEKTAIANVNPRPYDQQLDKYSVPSKLLEYMVSGNPTISTINDTLTKVFPTEVIWAGKGEKEALLEAMIKVTEMSIEKRKTIGKNASDAVLSCYSIENLGAKINHFIKSNK